MLSKNRGEEIIRIERSEVRINGRDEGAGKEVQGSWKVGGEAGRRDFLDQAFHLSIVDAGGANEISLALSSYGVEAVESQLTQVGVAVSAEETREILSDRYHERET